MSKLSLKIQDNVPYSASGSLHFFGKSVMEKAAGIPITGNTTESIRFNWYFTCKSIAGSHSGNRSARALKAIILKDAHSLHGVCLRSADDTGSPLLPGRFADPGLTFSPSRASARHAAPGRSREHLFPFPEKGQTGQQKS